MSRKRQRDLHRSFLFCAEIVAQDSTILHHKLHGFQHANAGERIAVDRDDVHIVQAINSLDIPGELGLTLAASAKRVRAKMPVIVSPQDHLVNPIPAREFADAIAAPILTLDSPCGHISLDCISVGPTVAKFLADPTSVHSETLHDAVHH